MTDTLSTGTGATRPWRKFAISLVTGGVTGGLASFAFLSLTDVAVVDLGLHAEIAGLIAVVYIVTGLGIGVGLLLPGLGSQFLNVEDAEELREQRAILTLSSTGMIAAGAALMFAALAAPEGPLAMPVALAGIAVAMIVSVWTSFATMRRQDEFMRQIGKEVAAMAYYLLALVGGTWALLAHVSLASAPTPLDWLSMIWALMLLAAFVATGRRGLLKPR